MARIISAFPGTGKSHYYKNHSLYNDWDVYDSDSSKFDKTNFPLNYIEHIKQLLDDLHWIHKDKILVSSHKDVREALVKENIWFTLVYPDISLKEEYLERYRNRGDSEAFIKLLSDNWTNWIVDCMDQKYCDHIILKSGQYLSDVI